MNIQINDLNVFVDERGAANADPILFIHGFPFDHSMWRHQMAQFSVGYHCIAPDLRGHGGTTEIEGHNDPVTIDTFADDLIALLDQMLGNSARVTLCGLSMGGYVAFALWRKIPARISRLILADTKATPDTPEARTRRQVQADKVALEGVKAISNGMLDGLIAPIHRQDVIGMEVRRMIESTSPQGVINALGALANRPDSTPTLSTITVPTLCIVGEHDTTTPINDARYIHERLTRTTPLVIIPDAGHVTSLENPGAFNQAVTDFLSVH